MRVEGTRETLAVDLGIHGASIESLHRHLEARLKSVAVSRQRLPGHGAKNVTSSSDRLLLWQGRALTSATIDQVRAGQTITVVGKRTLPGGSVAPEKVNDKLSLMSIDSRRSEQRPEVTDFDASSSALNGL